MLAAFPKAVGRQGLFLAVLYLSCFGMVYAFNVAHFVILYIAALKLVTNAVW
jgi:hypothetical protein